jgi:hypothetical protein
MYRIRLLQFIFFDVVFILEIKQVISNDVQHRIFFL